MIGLGMTDTSTTPTLPEGGNDNVAPTQYNNIVDMIFAQPKGMNIASLLNARHQHLDAAQQVLQNQLMLTTKLYHHLSSKHICSDVELQKIKNLVIKWNPIFLKYGYPAIRLDF